MARILTTCRSCGDVEVTLDDISVQMWGDTDHGEYTLRCPVCATVTVWPATPSVIDLLAASGVRLATGPDRSGRPSTTGSSHRPRAGEGPNPAGRRRPTPGRHLRRR